MAEFKILAFQNLEFKILADFKILAFYKNLEFKILADFKILAFQNYDFKMFADFKILAFQNSRFWKGKVQDFGKVKSLIHPKS